MTTPYTAFRNRFRQDLIAGKRRVGCWCSLGSPITTEVLGVAGFDWILLDAEHAPNDVLSLIPQLMALKDSASAPVVRPSSNAVVEIKRLLDAGFHNFAAGHGHLGNPTHPEVQAAMAAVFAAAKAAGKPVGILSPVEADARRYLEMGASCVAVGSDLGVLRMGTQALADKYRSPGAAALAAQY